MGRKRIHIARIPQDKRRRATLSKRRKGLLKKAMELSILCDCEVAVFIMTKDETSAYATNGDANETVQRALSTGPMVTHNGMYDSLYLGGDDDDSGDDFDGEEEVNEEPAGGSLTSKPPPSRSKRKREQVTGMNPPPTTTSKRRAMQAPLGSPAPSAAPVPVSVGTAPITAAHSRHPPPETEIQAAPVDSSALLQQMAILSRLLQQNGGGSSTPLGLDHSSVSAVSANLLGVLKNSVDGLAQSNASTTRSPQGSNSPLMPIGELSPGMSGMSPHFPFAGMSPPAIPASLTPPSLDGHILDVNFSVSPAREVPTFQDLTGRLKSNEEVAGGLGDLDHGLSGGSTSLHASSSSSAPASKTPGGRGLNGLGGMSGGPGLGLRVSVPQAPRVFNIPPHLMSSTSVPTGGLISANGTAPSSGVSAPGGIIGGLSATSPPNSATKPALQISPTGNSDAQKFPAPLLSSMQAPAFPFAGTQAANGEWAPLQSPLVNPNSFIYSPFLYSPRT